MGGLSTAGGGADVGIGGEASGGSAGAAGSGSGGNAGTDVCGNVVDATWTEQGSPYRLTCDVRIVGLTVQPGVVVQSAGDYVFEVAGLLDAVGSRDRPILFTKTSNNSAGWRGVFFNAAQTTNLAYVVVEESTNGGISIVDTAVALNNCTLQRNEAIQGGGLYVSGASSSVVVRNSMIRNNVATDYFEAGGGIFVRDGASVEVSNTVIASNVTVYANARGGGVFLCGGHISAINATIVENGGTVYGNGSGGIAVNTGGLSDCAGGTLTLDSSILFNNVSFQISGTGATVDYSDVQGGYTGTGNIAANPLFADADYRLVADASPCIDAGNPDSAYNETCLPPGLGAPRNDMGAYGGPGACGW